MKTITSENSYSLCGAKSYDLEYNRISESLEI